MEKFLIQKNINKEILTENIFLKQNLIFEDIYLNDIFNNLIEFIIINYQQLITEYFELNTEQILFRLILPYTQLNWFNKIFRESLETIRQNEI